MAARATLAHASPPLFARALIASSHDRDAIHSAAVDDAVSAMSLTALLRRVGGHPPLACRPKLAEAGDGWREIRREQDASL